MPGGMSRLVGSATFWTVLATAAAMALLFGTFAVLGGWPGPLNGCHEHMRPACFCETLRAGAVAQPVNTWSNLGFVIVGLAIAIHADRARRRRPEPVNPMTTSRVFPIVFAVVTALLGPGSMALHATMTVWGGRLDVLSMYLFIGLVAAYAYARLFGLGGLAFTALFAVTVAVLGWTKLYVPLNSDFFFGGMIGVALVGNIAVRRRHPELRFDPRFLALAIGCFVTAFAIWLPSRSGGPLCDPDHWLQGHAVWHVLCAGAAGAVYLYIRSERRLADFPA